MKLRRLLLGRKAMTNLSSVQFSCSAMSNSLWPYGLQHTRLPCPSPTPGVYSNSCLSSWWCHLTVSPSVVPFSSCLQSDKPRERIKKQTHYFADKGPYTQSYGFFSSHVCMWELDHKEDQMPKNWCFWIAVLEKTLESPLDCKEIKPVNPKGNQPWIFFGRTDTEAEAPIPWPPDAKNWLIRKDPDAGKDWMQVEKGKTLDEMLGWHHQLDGHEFEQAPGIGDWTGKPGVLQFMGWQRVQHEWATELNWTLHIS